MTLPPEDAAFALRHVRANGLDIEVATAGEGPAILLLHGWPHTWRLWTPVMDRLRFSHRIVAPDLRGLGGTTRTAGGYDVTTLAQDAVALMDALDVPRATVVGIDLGVQVAAMIALKAPGRVERLALMEGLLGRLPGAEEFLAKGPPWWFGFHAMPGLAETVIAGHEAEYIDWFLTGGTADRQGIDRDTRDAFVAAYTGQEALRCGFEHYRAFGQDAEQIAAALAEGGFAMPTLAIEGGVIGAAISQQLEPVSADFRRRKIEQCGHLIPMEQPHALSKVIREFAAA